MDGDKIVEITEIDSGFETYEEACLYVESLDVGLIGNCSIREY